MTAPEYTGRAIWAEVTHITRGYGLPEGLVVMSIRVIGRRRGGEPNLQELRPDHTLKTDLMPFVAVWDGYKTHEVRRDDRGFKPFDCLMLRELRAPVPS